MHFDFGELKEEVKDKNKGKNIEICLMHEKNYDLLLEMIKHEKIDNDKDCHIKYHEKINDSLNAIENRINAIYDVAKKIGDIKDKENILNYYSRINLLHSKKENFGIDGDSKLVKDIELFSNIKYDGLKYIIEKYYTEMLFNEENIDFKSKQHRILRKNLEEFLLFNIGFEKLNIPLTPQYTRGQTYNENFRFKYNFKSRNINENRHFVALNDLEEIDSLNSIEKFIGEDNIITEQNHLEKNIGSDHSSRKNKVKI